MNYLEQLSKPLSVDQIDFRIQSINKGGYATILAYKDARVDMHRLNEVFGVGKWQRKHELINGQLFCSVGIHVDGEWAWVQDVGTPSNTEAAKGQASDSFKRACFNLGIGIELYDYPVIQVKLNQNEFTIDNNGKAKQSWNLKLKEWSWFTQFTNGELTCIAAKDEKGRKRFQSGEYREGTDTSPQRAAVKPASQPNKEMAPEYNYKPTQADWDNLTALMTAYSELDKQFCKELWHELADDQKMFIWANIQGITNGDAKTTIKRNLTEWFK